MREVSAPSPRYPYKGIIGGSHKWSPPPPYHLVQISTFNPLSILRNVVNLPRFFSNGARTSLVRSSRIERRGGHLDSEPSRTEPSVAELSRVETSRDEKNRPRHALPSRRFSVSNQPPFPYRYPMQFYTGHVASDPKELHPLV